MTEQGFDMQEAARENRQARRIRKWAEIAMKRVVRDWRKAERQALAEDRERLIAEGRFTPPRRKEQK